MILVATKRPMAARARTMRATSAARRRRQSDRSVGRGEGSGARGRPAAGLGPFFDLRLMGRAIPLILLSRPVGDYTTPCFGGRIAGIMIQNGERGQVMITAKHAAALAALSALVALAVPAGGPSRSGGYNPDDPLGP